MVSARVASRRELGWVIRLWGAGGFLGGFGLFRCKRLGNLDVYASRFDGLVLIRRRNRRPLLITPERPEALVELVGRITAEPQ